DMPKQFLKLAGLPVLIHTLRPFEQCEEIDEIIIVSLEEYIQSTWDIVIQNNMNKVKKIVVGGKTRQESSKIGIDCCGDNTSYVLIHDAVR
ncbi:MAG: ACP S-acetyltransferase, partial [Candidatus Dadabacteria bacterium]|nr:ACP S-acetyltransferase [Candidatus Dadabacteria bacterium]